MEGKTERLIGEKINYKLRNADFLAMNLETPLVDKLTPIRKCGPCLAAPTKCVEGIKCINPHFFTLANNHIMGQGVNGLKSTISTLRKYGIMFAGAGKNIGEAKKPFVINLKGKKVGFLCCAEHEFSIARDDYPGANPYDPLDSFDEVKALKEKSDYVIVLYHGGKEHYRYPSPQLQKTFRKFADVGADLVIAQHTHCIGCREQYNGCELVYGQGNFLFDYSDSVYWKESLLIEVDLNTKKIEYIPIIKDGCAVREAGQEEKEKILKDFYIRSDKIKSFKFLEKEYDKLAASTEVDYLYRFFGRFNKNIFIRIINKLLGYKLFKWLYPDRNRVLIENVLDCEAHRELASRVMKGKL